MTKHKKRTVLGLALSLSILSGTLAPKTLAIEPSYSVGAPYATSIYYERLRALLATGDEKYDVVAVAITQLGYHEGNRESEMHGMNESGNRNFAEYNRIIGAPLDNGEGNGVSYGFEWCAAFVSWCLRQADVPDSTVITEVSCTRLCNWLKGKNLYTSRNQGYKPEAGDLIFFKYSASSYNPSHVGLVVGSDSTYVYTIEGNNGGRVDYHRYRLTDSTVMGYARPDYDTLEGTDYGFELKQGYVEPGIYVTTADLNVRTSQSTSSASLGKIPKGTALEITEAVNGWARVSYGSLEGWSSLDYLRKSGDISYKIEYVTGEGTEAPDAQTVKYGSSITLSALTPTKKAYAFLGWATSAQSNEVEYAPGDTYRKNADLTLYAVWEFVGFEISFLDHDGTLLSKKTYAPGDTIEPPTDPERPDDLLYRYSFSGWSPAIPDSADGDAVFTATYEKTLFFLPDTNEDKTDADSTEAPKETDKPSSGEDNVGNKKPSHTLAPKRELASLFAAMTALIAAIASAFFIKKKN